MEFHSIGGDDGILFDALRDESILRPLVDRLSLCRLVLKVYEKGLLPDLLRVCGAGLRELVLESECATLRKNDILAISAHCTKLSLLAIHSRRVEGTLAPIWRSLGSTLTHIYFHHHLFTAAYESVDIISVSDLMKHAVNPLRIDMQMLNDAAANVLIALGSRIRVLGFAHQSVVGTAPWREVYRGCTNLEAVHLALYPFEESVDVLSLMRTKLVSLRLRILEHPNYPYAMPYQMLIDGQFFSALSACSALKKFEFFVRCCVPEELLRKLFGSLKSVTSLTCVMGPSDVNPNKDVIDGVARNSTNLESFTISAVTQVKGEDVNALVDLPRLKSETLRYSASLKLISQSPVEYAVEVVNKLKDCATGATRY